VRSARRKLLIGALVGAAGVLVASALAGCETTQKAAARVQVRNERALVAREPVKVGQESADVRVVDATIVRGDGDAAIAVTLQNTSPHTVNDLPIEVGVDGEVLNDGKELPYFESHVPALAPGAKTTWVYVSKDDLAGAKSAFAKVGAKATDPQLAQASSLPSVTATAPAAATGDRVQLHVNNSSDFTQYDLVVYAWGVKGGDVVAAGQADGGDLDAGKSEDVAVKLIGSPKGAQLAVAAPPTIFK
jgi:hypothetical protein